MARKLLFVFLFASLVVGLVSPILLPVLREQAAALEKVKLGSPSKVDPGIYLPVVAAEDKGFWRENGVEVEWVPFGSGVALIQAVAAGDINIGTHGSIGPVQAAERGVPVVMVAELAPNSPFVIWVRTDSPYRLPRDLKGVRIGISALGTAGYALAQIILKAHGMEKDVRFVGVGSSPAALAGLRAGAFEAAVVPRVTWAPFKAGGIVWELASSADYVPKPWVDYVVFARKDYARTKPDLVKKVVRATVQATDFIRKNPRWAWDKMKSVGGVSEEAAKVAYESIEFTTSGRLDQKAVENLRRVFMEFGILTEKAPAAGDLFTNDYLPQ